MTRKPLFLLLLSAFFERAEAQGNAPTNSTLLPVGSCTPDIPCSNDSCCNGATGFCGFGPDFCGTTCTSDCNAKAECGPFANFQNFTCPLSVCCSEFGFCGTTEDFCDSGCQSNCGSPSQPSCDTTAQTATTRRIGYYEGWAVTRGCMAYTPEQIAVEYLTHVNFAFALLSDDFKVIEMTPGDAALWSRTTALKAKQPSLKVFLSIGGWSFNDPPTQNIFSDLVASQGNTNTFIASVLNVMETYGFDGIDIDWEYPGASDRGGVPADTENYTVFMTAVKIAFNQYGYGLSFTAPSSYWYLQHFDLGGLLLGADWVNVMTYDLHGTWDGTDPYIGAVVLAHTNLTEIDDAFQLFWRASVDPGQMVMGMGFYGRSFTLASADCASPGCPWVSGAAPGPCSANSGTLMYSEIQTILQTDEGVIATLDPTAAVEYIVWDTNQWVSYDNAESFALKMNYANSHCIGGTMIWSVDQDDASYSALQALYPNIAAAPGEVVSGDQCKITECGALSCTEGQTPFSTIMTNPLTPGKVCTQPFYALLCCPQDYGVTDCVWRGGGQTPCIPHCDQDELLLATDIADWTTGSTFISGSSAYCCKTTLPSIADTCGFQDCTSDPSTGCNSGPFNILITTAIQGPGAPQFEQCTGSNCPQTCTNGQVKPFCCNSLFPYSACEWVGQPPLCQDTACPVGKVQIMVDAQGDADQPCYSGTRSYCCDPQGDVFVPVPFGDVFPNTVDEGIDSFTVDFDPDESGSTDGTSSSMPNDEAENDEAFGEVFIDSPNANAVSSLDLESDWVVTSCDPTSDQSQQVLAYCSKSMSDDGSGCSHVMIGGAENTIVKMPQSCGKGPYARVASLEVHSDQSALPASHRAIKPANELVYLLNFDYEFASIPESNGPIYMRADVTDLPGYWDEIVDSPASKRKRWMDARGMEERWWGSFLDWVNKLNTITSDTSVSRNFHWSDQWVIYEASTFCPGPPEFEADFSVTLTGTANFDSRYGFYLQATIVPPSIQQAYVYVSADAFAQAVFEIDAHASVTYDSTLVEFASFGFPGLSYPGLITIGPSLVLSGYITGHLSLGGSFTTTLQYTMPSVSFSLGKTGADGIGPNVTANSPAQNTKFNPALNIELDGDVSLHMVPQVQLGISILGGSLMDAEAFIRADLSAGVSINGSVSLEVAPEFCYQPYFGIVFEGGLTGSVLFWEGQTTTWPFYSATYNFGGQCFSAESEPSSKRNGIELYEPDLFASARNFDPSQSGAYMLQRSARGERRISPTTSTNHLARRGSVPGCPGSLICPQTDTDVTSGGDQSDGDPYDDLNLNPADDAFYRRDLDGIPNEYSDHSVTLGKRVKISVCQDIEFDPLAYANVKVIAYYDLANQDDLDPLYKGYQQKQGRFNGNTYAKEHVYEMQLLALFISEIADHDDVYGNMDFCDWVKEYIIQAKYTFPSGNGATAVIDRLRTCVPSNSGALNSMPVLESVANGIKASAFNGNRLRTSATFQTYTFSKKVFIMRATAGLMSYMNSGPVSDQFVQGSNCVKGIWAEFWTAYINDPNTNGFAPNAASMQPGLDGIYGVWIGTTMATFKSNLVTGITQMLTFWRMAAGQGVTQAVILDFGTDLVDPMPITSDVDDVMIQTNLVNYVQNTALGWIGQL